MIQVLNKIDDFDLFIEGSDILKLKCGEFVKFKISAIMEIKQIIGFYSNDNKYCTMDLLGRREQTKVKGLHWRNFSNSELTAISAQFQLETEKIRNVDTGNNLSILINYSGGVLSRTEMALKKLNNDEYIIAIFYLDYPDKTFDGHLFVYGIWQTKLDEEFVKIYFEPL